MDKRRKYILEGSLGALIQEYRASPEFDRLVDGTKQASLRSIDRLTPLYRVKVDEIRRRHIITLRNQIRHTPGAANHLVSVVSVLMKFAVMMEYRDDLLAGIEKLPIGEHSRWSDQDVEFALDNFPEHLRRAVVLALHTGQRASDLVKMKWTTQKRIDAIVQRTRMGGGELVAYVEADTATGEHRVALLAPADGTAWASQGEPLACTYASHARRAD